MQTLQKVWQRICKLIFLWTLNTMYIIKISSYRKRNIKNYRMRNNFKFVLPLGKNMIWKNMFQN